MLQSPTENKLVSSFLLLSQFMFLLTEIYAIVSQMEHPTHIIRKVNSLL